MDEQTTTVTPPVDAGGTTPQPSALEAPTAAETPPEPTNTNPQPASPAEPSKDDNLEWLKNKGIDPSSPEAITAIADKWRTAEREMHKKTEQASDIGKKIATENQSQIADAEASGNYDAAQLALARVAALEVSQSVNSFFANNPDAKQHEAAMTKIITDRPQVGQMVRSGALGIEDLYAMARGGDTNALADAKTQGGKEALQQLANKQTATAVPGAATTSAVNTQKPDPIAELWAD